MSFLETGGRDGITCISNFSGHASRIRFDAASSFMKTNFTHIGIKQHPRAKQIANEIRYATTK
jgi:hypothetical protein